MSDSQKQQRPGATPIKNPLLSASVTGLTFDDFPNKPLLLPAAPPIVHAPVLAPVVTISGLVAKEPKSLVTVGSSSLDIENLDEINLNASNENNQTSDTTEPNANPLLEQSSQGVNNDSILSQAASSFSALPSVASNVFSTFSKRITAISSRETTPIHDQYQQDSNANVLASQIDIQPTYIQHSQQGDLSQAPPPFYAPPLSSTYISSTSTTSNQQDTPTSLEPPTFYAPADIPPVPSAAPPSNLGGQNNFRFSSKKKVYAPIPGLSDRSQKPTTTLDPSTVSAPISCDTTYAGYSANNYYSQPQYSTTEEQTLEERKLGSGLFSKISNLAPAGVLQNISGLVQSAAGSLTQTNKTNCSQQTPLSVLDQQNIYFAASSPATNYLAPPSLSVQQTNVEPPSAIVEHTSAQNVQYSSFFSDQQSKTSNFFSPQPITQGINETSFQPHTQTQIPLISSYNLPTHINPSSQPPRPNRPPLNVSSTQLPPSEQSVNSNQSNPTESDLSTATLVAFFDHTKYLPQSGQANAITQSNVASHSLPPTINLKVPPPTSGPTSYRLQKGTKLYKNPLTPQETAPIHVTPNQNQAINQSVKTYSSQQSFNTHQSVPLFASSPVGKQNVIQSAPTLIAESVPIQSAQSVPLFVPTVEETKSVVTTQIASSLPISTPPPLAVAEPLTNKSVQSVPLFAHAHAHDLKTNETSQKIPLFDPNYNPIDSNVLLAPQVEEVKTEEDTNVSLAPPSKKLKSDESIQDSSKSTTSIKNNNLNQIKINEPEQTAGLESFESKFVARVPKQDSNSDFSDNKETQQIFDLIRPVLEENITEIQTQTIPDPLEETLQRLSLTESSSHTKSLKLPPIAESFNLNNPYRRGSATETAKPASSLPALANFFTPESSECSANLNFFAALPATQQASASGINYFSESVQDKEIKEDKLKSVETLQADTTNFFATAFTSELIPIEPATVVHPPISAFFPKPPTDLGLVPTVLENKNNDITKHLNESFVEENVPPPIGFERFTQLEPTAPNVTANTGVHQINTTVQQKTINQTQQPEIVNRFSNYFNQVNQQSENPSTFFDSFSGRPLTQPPLPQQQIEVTAPCVITNEEQRIQNFFNNPPPKDASAVGDLNYDLVHSGLGIKRLQQRSLTPISNLVEPPSSACSEFSELSNSTAGQKSIAANLSITGSEKLIGTEEASKSVTEVPDSSIRINSSSIKHHEELPEEILVELRMANLLSADKTATKLMPYKPAVKHWFFKNTIGDKHIWVPFSHYDSALLETSLLMRGDDKSKIVAVEGGRYDVNISERKKISVYWDSPPIEVRRCSWFYKAVDTKYVPYEEQTAELLENEYKQAAESGIWHKAVVLGMGEQVEFHGPTVIVHFQQKQNTDAWGGTTQTTTRPRVVRRDLDVFNIEPGESQKVDHLLFMVHGIGSACDLKLRSVEEVVEDFRTIARQLVQSHYKNSTDLGLVGRVEVLPISWHSHLHSVEMGIDEKLRMITLESIPKLRNFTNDTLLDILFYTSPTFCQKIMTQITSSMNTLYLKYRERHPEFNGGVSLAGHSLGSLILFDLLCHQNPIKESEEKNLEKPEQFLTPNLADTEMDSNQLEDKQMSYTMGPAGTGQPFIDYAQLIFQPKKFFALGSPIGMFVTIRGIDKLGLDFRLPTCPGFYNIFHPYDPVAYRIEALVNPDLSGVRPVLIPHHKGRKRMHLELKETMTRVSTDLKNRFLDKFKTTLDSVNIFGIASKSTKEAEELMEKEVDKVIQMQMQLEQQNHNNNSNDNLPSGSDSQNETVATPKPRTESVSTAMSDDIVELDFPLGKLNDSKRIDYVLQEAPLEFINEYIFALSSHVCYWDSEDTILFVMKEIYSGLGISPDSQVPQQTMTIERPSSRNSLLSSS